MATLECPICRRSIAYTSKDEVPFRPFCSKRCKLVDLGRWLSEEYRISEEMPTDVPASDASPPATAEDTDS